MNPAATAVRETPDEADLQVTLAEVLSASLGPGVSVEAVAREPSRFATLSPAEVLSVSLTDGRSIRLFLKHLGPEHADHPDKLRHDRELRVYERLFVDGDLPVVRCFGSRASARPSRYQLYLEYVDDWPLRYQGLEHWFHAARRLAHLHAHFAARRGTLLARDYLLTMDEGYFAAWCARAVAAAGEQSAPLGRRLDALARSYRPACGLLAAQPPTLVHNDLAPKNVIADRSMSPARICIVDWEVAGVGCGLLDLVHLKYGLAEADDREMLTQYRSALAGSDLLPRGDRQFARLLAACELHKTLYRLAHSLPWKLPPATIAQWVGEAEAFLERVREP